MKVVDMHCDTISKIHSACKTGRKADLRTYDEHLSLDKMKAGDYLLQNFALYINLETDGNPFQYAMEMLDTFYCEMEKNKDLIGIVKNYEDIEDNIRQGKMSALLTLEEGEACLGNLAFLRDFYRLGVRMMTLTWNYKNSLGFPNKPGMPDTENGLTDRGIEFVQEMEKLGMIIDISHLNDAGIWDVFKYTKKPFVASHSNCRSLASHPRNLTDEMIKKLSERGGVAGINYYSSFLRDWKQDEIHISYLSDMINHMKYMKNIGGIECIGLGSDFDGISGKLEMETAEKLPMLENAMRKAGFTENEVEAVFYKNVLRVYREIL